MRGLVLVVVAACSFERPRDVCEGACQLYSTDKKIISASTTMMLEGRFEDDGLVTFPSAQPVEYEHGSSRAKVALPIDATTGLITVTSPSGTTDAVPYRRTSFGTGLTQFYGGYSQDDVGRMAYPATVRNGAAAVVVGGRVYVIGGASLAGALDTIEVALANVDGTLGPFATSPQRLTAPRAFATVTQIGSFIYLVGGTSSPTGALKEVLRAEVIDGVPGLFTPTGRDMLAARSAHATVIIGNYLYVIGGSDGTVELDTMERAPIFPSGELGDFEALDGKHLITGRAGHGGFVDGKNVYVLGGVHGSQTLKSVERIELYDDGYIADAVDAGLLQDARAYFATVAIDNAVYVMGGRATVTADLDTVERASLPAETLAFAPIMDVKLSQSRKAMASVVLGDNVLLLGGSRSSGTQDVPATQVDRSSFVGAGVLEGFGIVQNISLRTPRCEHTSIVIGNKVYVIGGLGAGPLKSIEVADIAPDGTLGEFKTLQGIELKDFRSAHVSAVFGDYLYVLGGFNASGVTASSNRARIKDDGTLEQFTDGEPLAVARSYAASAVVENKLYVLGGLDAGNTAVATVEYAFLESDQTASTFSPTPSSMANARKGHSAIVLGSNLYVLGGRAGSTMQGVERATIDGNADLTWGAPINAMLATPRERHRTVVLGNYVYMIDGYGNNNGIGQAERARLNPDGTWPAFMSAITVTEARISFSTVTTGDYVYMIGGCSAGSPVATIERSRIK